LPIGNPVIAVLITPQHITSKVPLFAQLGWGTTLWTAKPGARILHKILKQPLLIIDQPRFGATFCVCKLTFLFCLFDMLQFG